jgi:hypothetical protein
MSVKRALLQRHIEEAESRVQRGQRNVDHQRKTVSDLERDKQDATIAKALVRMFEKAHQRTGKALTCEFAPRGDDGALVEK